MDNTERRIVVRRKSWHYRLVSSWNGGVYKPTNLCSHFWSVVGCIFAMGAAIPLTIMAAPILALAFGSVWVWNHRPWRWKAVEATPHDPNLLVEWLKAKKRRICPLIEVRDA